MKKYSGLYHDSRKVIPNSVFFCLDGAQTSGAKFAAEAVSRGAVCVVAEKFPFQRGRGGGEADGVVETLIVPDVRRSMALMAKGFYGSKCDEMRIIGVVGTNGKTTCAHIMKHILGENVGILGTLHGEMTTPDPIDLHRKFGEMYDAGIRTVVMEASAHAIHFKKLDGITFEAVIFTNITQDHLDFFGTFENYCNTKVNFFLGDGNIKTAIVNIDNRFGQKIIKERQGASAAYLLQDVQLFPDKSVVGGFEVNIPGRFNAANALACITCARVLGVDNKRIKAALKTIPRIPGRFNLFKVGEVTAIVDFAHTPDGLEKIILAVKEFARARVITVFGCGGNRDKEKRPIMGEISARLSDFTVITSDNPRFERPISIMKQIRQGLKNCINFKLVKDRTKAIRYAFKIANPGDIIIIAGKGGEEYFDIKGKKLPYTDEAVVHTITCRK